MANGNTQLRKATLERQTQINNERNARNLLEDQLKLLKDVTEQNDEVIEGISKYTFNNAQTIEEVNEAQKQITGLQVGVPMYDNSVLMTAKSLDAKKRESVRKNNISNKINSILSQEEWTPTGREIVSDLEKNLASVSKSMTEEERALYKSNIQVMKDRNYYLNSRELFDADPTTLVIDRKDNMTDVEFRSYKERIEPAILMAEKTGDFGTLAELLKTLPKEMVGDRRAAEKVARDLAKTAVANQTAKDKATAKLKEDQDIANEDKFANEVTAKIERIRDNINPQNAPLSGDKSDATLVTIMNRIKKPSQYTISTSKDRIGFTDYREMINDIDLAIIESINASSNKDMSPETWREEFAENPQWSLLPGTDPKKKQDIDDLINAALTPDEGDGKPRNIDADNTFYKQTATEDDDVPVMTMGLEMLIQLREQLHQKVASPEYKKSQQGYGNFFEEPKG